MRGPTLDALPADLRETRLRTLVDELRWQRDQARKRVSTLEDRVERQNIKLNALRRERNGLDEQLRHAQRELAKKGVRT